jgi:radical SAM superfamily enzyme YgiQ (UPF0313 family)
MKVLLISPHPDILAFGVRSISAYIKKTGTADAHLMFLPYMHRDLSAEPDFHFPYPESVLKQVAEIAGDYDLVGISLMTNYFDRARQLTGAIRSAVRVPVIWGGIHPTVAPQECAEWADYVVRGEGERPLALMLEKYAKNEPVAGVPNLAVKTPAGLQENPPDPLLPIEEIPAPDWDWEDHYIIWQEEVQPMTLPIIKAFLSDNVAARQTGMIVYQTMATRGCPHGCSYCCNYVLRRLYDGQTWVRRRPLDDLIAELQRVKEKMPFIKIIDFQDDSFSAGTEAEIERFSKAYKEKINLPYTLHVSPLTISRKKMDDMTASGLMGVVMGIQSGSEKTLALYGRPIFRQKVMDAAELLQAYQRRIGAPFYDIIVDNPLEEDEDLMKTLRLLLALPRPFRLRLFSLVLFPGTTLHTEAKKRGLIHDPEGQIYRKHYHVRKDTYYKLLMALLSDGWPRFLVRAALWPPMRMIFNRPALGPLYPPVYRLSLLPVRALRLAGFIAGGRWEKIRSKLRPRPSAP